jgi:hypothetical protein
MSLRLGIAVATAASLIAATAIPARAAITIGQLRDVSAQLCGAGYDWLQPTVPSGNSFVVPGTGTITSWTMVGSGPAGQQLTMKMYRKIGEPTTYQVIGHAGPQTLTPGGTAGNTFPASIPVMPGDVLGFHTVTNNSRCSEGTLGARLLTSMTDLADGASTAFDESTNTVISIQASFVPDNTFTRGNVKRNKNKGTATVTLNLPNPGKLTGSGGGAKVAAGAATSKTVAAGRAKLVIRAKGKRKATLNETGKVKVKPTITYTPTGGEPGTQKLKLKLLKR